jgi:hypothetical protein
MEDNYPAIRGAIQRSHAYPSLTLLETVEFVRKIYTQLGVSSFQTRDTIAKVLNFSPDTLNKRLSTASQYELLDSKAKEGYKATPLFIKIYKPMNDTEKREALLQCLKNPKLYAALLEEYKNNIVPSVVGLSTNLYRNHNISESASEKAAQVFITNLTELGLLDEDNHLLLGEELPIQEEGVEERKAFSQVAPSTLVAPRQFYGGGVSVPLQTHADTDHVSGVQYQEDLPLVISLKEGKKAKLIYPEGITNDDWDKIIRIIQAMKE